jgi:hypothetical protein
MLEGGGGLMGTEHRASWSQESAPGLCRKLGTQTLMGPKMRTDGSEGLLQGEGPGTGS